MPLKEINERTTNREGGQRRRDKRRAAREGAAGEEVVVMVGDCVSVGGVHTRLCVARGVLCEVHSCLLNEILSPSFLVFFFLFFSTYSHSLTTRLSPSSGYFPLSLSLSLLSFSLLLSFMIYIPLLHHIPAVLAVTALCL